jgi:NADH-quinone oxidoreductase subunit L
MAALVGGLSARLRGTQNGYARSYALSMLGGAAALVAATLLMRGV